MITKARRVHPARSARNLLIRALKLCVDRDAGWLAAGMFRWRDSAAADLCRYISVNIGVRVGVAICTELFSVNQIPHPAAIHKLNKILSDPEG